MKSEVKLFVGGLPWATDDSGLRAVFERFGTVRDSVVVKDRDTGRSRGFGFVEFEAAEDAESAQRAMDGGDVEGRRVSVDFADERPRRQGGRR